MAGMSSSPLDAARAPISALLEQIHPEEHVIVTAEVDVRKDKQDEFEKRVRTFELEVSAIPDVLLFNYGEAKEFDDRIRYLLYEDWRTAEAFRKRWFSAELEKFGQDVMPFLAGPPRFQLLRVPPHAPRPRVLQTGARKCWDIEGREIDGTGTGQDGEIRSGIPAPDPRFRDNGNGTVTDLLTDLTWLKNADAFGELEWRDALNKARTLSQGGYGLTDGSKAGDWRLANIRELLSLIDYGESDPILPRQNPFPFDNVKTGIYWTSTTLTPAPRLAWMMTLGIGPTVFLVKDSRARMWPVRGNSGLVLQTGQEQAWDSDGKLLGSTAGSGQDGDVQAGVPLPAASQRFEDQKDGTVRDLVTGLVWLKNADAFGFKTWTHALACCRSLRHGEAGLADGSERGQWRLPNVREIESLVDYGQVGPCLPTGHPFDNVRPSSYWTSTTVAAGPTEAMFIILGVGPSIFESKEHQFFVWPVRDSLPRETAGR